MSDNVARNPEEMTEVVRFRVAKGKKRKLERIAQRKYTTVSALARGLLLDYADQEEARLALADAQPEGAKV